MYIKHTSLVLIISLLLIVYIDLEKKLCDVYIKQIKKCATTI
jgi:hypothetical protein